MKGDTHLCLQLCMSVRAAVSLSISGADKVLSISYCHLINYKEQM